MADQLEVHPPSLRQAGKKLQEAAERLTTAWHNLQSTVQGMGEMFGDDMVSSLIGASYQAAHEMADESYTSAAEGLARFGEGLVAMADVYDKVEDATTAESEQVGQQVSRMVV